jgi:hypothetical protein
MEIGRNDACHCGSGKKYKKCHLEKDEVANRKEREKAALNAAKVAAASAAADEGKDKKDTHSRPPENRSGFFQKMAGRMGFAGSQQRRTPQNKGG